MSFIFRSFSRPSFIFFSLFFFFLRVVRSRHYAAPLAKTEISRRSRRFPNSDEREKGLFVCVFLNKRIISKTNFIFFFARGEPSAEVPHTARDGNEVRPLRLSRRAGHVCESEHRVHVTKEKKLGFSFPKEGE